MPTRRIRLVPRTPCITFPVGESLACQSGTAAAQLVGGAAYPNLPSGWSVLSDHDFTSKTEGGWWDTGSAYYAIVTASGAGGTTVDSMASLYNRLTEYTGRAVYPVGFAGGSGPINTGYDIAAASQNTGFYIRFNIALSSAFVGHSSGVNKIWFCTAGTSSSGPCYFSAQGTGSGTLQFQVRTQRTPSAGGGARNLTPNVGTANLTRGARDTVEVVMRMNTCQGDGTANADGTCEVWFNGTKTHSYADVIYRGNGSTGNELTSTARWALAKWNPTWGGTGGTIATAQYMYMYDAAIGVGS